MSEAPNPTPTAATTPETTAAAWEGRSPFWPLLLLGAALLLLLVDRGYAEWRQHQFLAAQAQSPRTILAAEQTRQQLLQLRQAILELAQASPAARQLAERYGLAGSAPAITPPPAATP
ncbi:MAG: hypothetical protein WC789_00960 [Lentisphaeria bacterium]|jgi:hypothetical protein